MNKTLTLIMLLLLPGSLQLAAQSFTIRGRITNDAGAVIAGASAILKNTVYAAKADLAGTYLLSDVQSGSYILQVSALGYQTVVRNIRVNSNLTVHINLTEEVKQLDDVKVAAEKEKTFGVTRLKAVEGTTINAGKKSEVIVLNDVVANTAANNTRQIYAKVAGLNIWENDGAGIQLGIGGRGLNPNRITNFNTRQNGYDISADALGYPESYYSPPAELTSRIEILRGAASLQYGTQFGGLINFKLKDGPTVDKPLEITSRATTGSWGFFNSTTSIAGKTSKVQYYTFFQHKAGNGWRPNAEFNMNTGYASAIYTINDQLTVTVEYTHMNYLAHQPGGLTDAEFDADPRQSVRARNWFKVDWNLGAAIINYKINDHLTLNSRFFGLVADRQALGDLDYISRPDPGLARDLYRDNYGNYGNETRLLYNYNLANNPQTLLLGTRYYRGRTDRQQGVGNDGSTGKASDFDYVISDDNAYSKYIFPNYNVALFAENIFKITSKFSVIPGIRFENILTKADGFYSDIHHDGAGNIILSQQNKELLSNNRHFLIGGIGLSYIQRPSLQLYGNISQNYRGINFNDIHTANPNIRVDPNLTDEKGYSADLGMRGNVSDIFNYDVSIFAINYNNRIGTVQKVDPTNFNDYRLRTNVSQSRNLGFESFAELELLHFIDHAANAPKISVFTNLALINARYINSQETAYRNKKVELAPDLIFKTGLSYKHNKFSLSYQVSYTSNQFTDATNAVLTPNATDGLIPAYTVMDLSSSYRLNKVFSLEASVNNLADKKYFTRRAESYPGPGIIPADARGLYLTLQVKL